MLGNTGSSRMKVKSKKPFKAEVEENRRFFTSDMELSYKERMVFPQSSTGWCHKAFCLWEKSTSHQQLVRKTGVIGV